MIRRALGRFIGARVDRAVANRLGALQGRVTRETIMECAFEFAAKSGLDGDYLEFGCYRGGSFIRAYNAYEKALEAGYPGQKMTRRPMIAFDSFEGLPELAEPDLVDGYTVFEEGQYACSETEFLEALTHAGVDLNWVRTVPGFYEKSLSSRVKRELGLGPAMVVHIDCDLFSSAATVLDFVQDLVQDGTLVLFDDYYCYTGHPARGVRGAFREWLGKGNLWATPYLNYSWAGKAFILHRWSPHPGAVGAAGAVDP